MLSEIIVEPTTVWAAYSGFVLGVFVGVVIVQSEAKRARRSWREARRTWYEIEAVAVELRNEHKELPLHNAPRYGGGDSARLILEVDIGKLLPAAVLSR